MKMINREVKSMKYEHYKVGDTIPTLEGEEKIISFNGSIITTQSYVIGDNEELIENGGENMLTQYDVERILKEIDGKNHKVIFD